MKLCIGEIAKACGGKLVLQTCGLNVSDAGSETSGSADIEKVTEDTPVDSVVLDSRKVTAGGVFIATEGERVDGHRFIPQVFAAGAVLAVTQKTPEQVERECDVPGAGWGSYLLVEDTFQALKDIAEYYRSKLTLPIVGITGSVGKTSTKEFIAGVLAEKYHVLKTEGNFNNEIGVPLTLLRIREEHEAAVVEMGISDFGEMHRLSRMVRPNICVITNIGQCHLENLGSRDGILKAKTEIFDYMPADGEVCLNGEDDKLRTLGEVILGGSLESGAGGQVDTETKETVAAPAKKPHFFGLGNYDCEEVYADGIVSRGLWGSDAVIRRKVRTVQQEGNVDRAAGESSRGAGEENAGFPVQIPLPGAHMVINGAAAACVAGLLGLSKEQIAEGLRKIQPVGGRNNLIRLENCTVIDDCYNANPVSMKAAVDLLGLADTYRVAILGDMFELGEDSDALHREVGAYAAASGADCILCVGENARHLYEGALAARSGADRTADPTTAASAMVTDGAGRRQKILYYSVMEHLMNALRCQRDELLPKGCTVLVKASHGMNFAEVVGFLKSADDLA